MKRTFVKQDKPQHKRILASILSLMVGFTISLGCTPVAIAQSTPPNAIATGVIDYSRIATTVQRSPIPFRLPRILVYENALAGPGQFFATGGQTLNAQEQVTGYEINIMDSPHCAGASACTIAYSSAQVIVPGQNPTIEQTFAWMLEPGRGFDRYVAHAPHPPQWVSLSDGRRVYLVPWLLGAQMGYEQVVWDEQMPGGFSVRYTIGLKGGDPQWVIQMADSIFN